MRFACQANKPQNSLAKLCINVGQVGPFSLGGSEEGAFLRANNAGKFVASAQPSAIQIPIPIHKMPNSVLRDRPRPLANFAESD